jgi:Fe-S cluster biogenesis protein NfuA
MDNIDKFKSINDAIDLLRPAMQADGGDVKLLSVDGGIVTVKLFGTCLTCPSASLTLKHGIEKTLKEKCSWVTTVIRAS